VIGKTVVHVCVFVFVYVRVWCIFVQSTEDMLIYLLCWLM